MNICIGGDLDGRVIVLDKSCFNAKEGLCCTKKERNIRPFPITSQKQGRLSFSVIKHSKCDSPKIKV